MGYVYKIENIINNKVYIGKTDVKTPEERFKGHINDSKKNRNKNRPIYRAFKKYGISNFKLSTIEETNDAVNREIFWIAHYNSYKSGYNATLGGDGKCYFKYSDQQVINSYKKFGQVKLVARYLDCDVETIRKILRKNKIKIISTSEKTSIKVLMVENNLIFDSQRAAARYLIKNNLTKNLDEGSISSAISRLISGKKRGRMYGSHWEKVI